MGKGRVPGPRRPGGTPFPFVLLGGDGAGNLSRGRSGAMPYLFHGSLGIPHHPLFTQTPSEPLAPASV